MPCPSHAPSRVSVLAHDTVFSWFGRTAGLLVLFCAAGSPLLLAQTAALKSFGVGKKLDYLQTSAATPTSHLIIGDPGGPFHFSADIAGTNLNLLSPVPKVSLPNATQFTLTGSSVLMRLATSYSGKAALDTAFPNGSYTINAGASNLPVPLGAADAYPAEVPQVTNGTWDGQGRLAINATNGGTLNFNSFSGYATGVGGTITFDLYAVSGTTLGSKLTSANSVALSGSSSDPALIGFNIPAGLLQSDRTYYAEIAFTRIVNLNVDYLNTLGAFGMATFLNTTGLIISTAAPVTAPAITTQPASQTATVGTNVTLTVAASGNPAPTFQWRKDGISIGGATFASFSLSNVQLGDAGSYSVVASNGAGIATSDAAVLTINSAAVAPAFTTQPTSQAVLAGGSVTFIAAASGSPTPTFQWKKDSVAINGATNASLILNNVQFSDGGSYTVSATNSVNSVTSSPATLTVNPTGIAPVITMQPVSQMVIAGNAATFAATASGTPAPSFQWRKNGANISGAIGTSYSLSSVAPGDEGSYTVVVSNSAGAMTSDDASLSVIIAPANAVVSFAIE